VWLWRQGSWQPLPRDSAARALRAYSAYLDRKAAKGPAQSRLIDISHSSLWDRPETRIYLQGQLFNFKTRIEPSLSDPERQARRLIVQGLYGFQATLLEEDQAWRSVARTDYEYWFGPVE
jgi:hypothetical protein